MDMQIVSNLCMASVGETNEDEKCAIMDITDSGGVNEETLSQKLEQCLVAATQTVNDKTKDDISNEEEVEFKLLNRKQLANGGEEALSKIQNGCAAGFANNISPSVVVISVDSNNGGLCLPATLGVSCSSPGDGKCLDPNAPEFIPPSLASPLFYTERTVLNSPVSPRHIYGHMTSIPLNGDQMLQQQQQQALSWHAVPNCQMQPPPTTLYYLPRTPCEVHDPLPNVKPFSATANPSPRRIRGGMLTSNGGTRLTINVSHIPEGFDNRAGGGGIYNFSYTTGLTPRSSPRDLSAHYIFDEKAAELKLGTPRTTVMVRNIPNKYSQAELWILLDEHCLQQNSQISDSNTVESAFDFVYLPIDFKNRCNVGYGFVNFTSVEGTLRFYKARHLKAWERFNSAKICEISYARLQGREALEEHFRNSVFPCNTDEYLPVVFKPARNGRECTPPTVVAGHVAGKRSCSALVDSINSRSCENGGRKDDNINVSMLDNNNVSSNQSSETCMM